MSYTPGGTRAVITFGADGVAETQREIQNVSESMRRLGSSSTQSLQGMNDQAGGFASRLGSMKNMVIGLAAVAAVGSIGKQFGAFFSGTVEAAAGLHDMSIQTGASVAALMALREEASTSETTIDGIAKSMNKFGKDMAGASEGSAGMGSAIKALGLNFGSLKAMAPEQQMLTVATAMDKFRDGTGKAAVAMTLYGDEGAKMLPFLKDLAADSDEVAAKMTDQQAASKKAAAAMADDYADNMTKIGRASKESGTAISFGILPALYEASDAFLTVTTASGGLKDMINGLASDGSITKWARAGVAGMTYLIDVWQVQLRLVMAVKEVVMGSLNTMATFVTGSASAMKSFIEGDYSKSFAMMRTTATASVATAKEAAGNVAEIFSENTFGQKMRARLDEVKGLAAAAKEVKPNLNYTAGDGGAKAEKEAQAYASLITAIRTKTAENKLELTVGENASESQKILIKLNEELVSGKLKLSAAHLATAHAALVELAATEDQVKLQAAQREVAKYIVESTAARNDSTSSLATEYAMFGQSTDARELAMIAVKGQTEMEKKLSDMRQAKLPVTSEILAGLDAEQKARVLVMQSTLGQTKALGYASQLNDENKKFAAESISDPRARGAALLRIDAELWQERIKLAGDGTAAQKVLQQEYDTWYANRFTAATFAVDLTQATQMLDIMSALDDSAKSAAEGMANSFGAVGTAIGGLTTALTGYGRTQASIAAQLAAATKDAGGDTSKIQRANAAAAQQSAQAQIKSYGDMAGAAKGFFKEGSKGYSALQATEKAFRAYEMAMALETMVKKIFFKETEVAANVGLNATKIAGEATATAASTGLAATEASAWGITAVVKALASLPYPMNLIAGATTLAAVLAVGASMMGGVGGASAPSVSEQRQKAQGTGSVLGDADAKSESIANSLDVLEKNSGSDLNYTRGMLASLRAIETSIGGLGSQLVQGGLTGAYTDSASTGFFAKLGNSIFGGDTTVTDKGITANKITLSGALSGAWTAKQYTDTKTDGGWFHSDKNNVTTTGLGAAADMQFAKVIQNLAGGITEAAKLLGVGGDAFTQRLNSFVIDIGKVSLKGMTGDDIQKALEAVFSKLGDDMAQFGVAGLAQFQQVGEGYLETLTRVATDYSMLDSNLASIGMTFGAVGLSSIAAREDLISMAGGISSLSDKVSSFSDHFLTEAEQLAPVAKYVAEQMAALGYASVDTREEFKALVLSLNPADQASRTLFNSLLDLESAFDKTHVAAEDLVKTEKEIASERKDLQNQLDDLTMTAAELLKKQRDALDASNRSLFDQVQAAQAAKDANDAAKTSLSEFLTSTKSFATSVGGFNNNLLTGSLSTLTPEGQLAEARRQFEQTKTAALAGNAAAQGNLQAIENTFLTLSQKLNGGDAQYSSDLATVMQANDQLAAWATGQVDVAQASLDALNAQVSGIATLNATMLSVAQNIQYLPAVTGASSVPAFTQPVMPNIDYSSYGTANVAPLLAEMKAMREEIKAFRADAQQQTADKLVVAGKAAMAAADRIVDGVGDSVNEALTRVTDNRVDLKDF